MTAAFSAADCERLTVIRRSRLVLRPPGVRRALRPPAASPPATGSAAGSAAASNAAGAPPATFGAIGGAERVQDAVGDEPLLAVDPRPVERVDAEQQHAA